MKCLVVDKMHESLVSMLREIGVEADYQPTMKRNEIKQALSGYQGLIIRSKTYVDADLLENAKKLFFVARAGAGIDNLDVDYLTSRNIAILNAPEGNRNAVAEHTLGLLLGLLHHINRGNTEVRKGIWDREGNRGTELAGRTVAIIGYGFMGMAFARKLSGMDCRVIAYDKYKCDFSDNYCEEVSLDQVFEQADILSLHVPLTEETRYMADQYFLERFRKPIILLNTARGEVVSLQAFFNAMQDGRVTGAGLDVLENEKIAHLTSEEQEIFDKICQESRILLTPHVAGWTFESYVRINEVLSRKIARLLEENAQ